MASSTPKRALIEMEKNLNVPIFEGRLDRFCRSCGKVMEKAALRKFPGQKCPHCLLAVEGRKEELRTWDPCVDCDACILSSMKFCNMCGTQNVHFDQYKHSRIESIMRSRIEREVRAGMEEERTLMVAADEVEDKESQKSTEKTADCNAEGSKKDKPLDTKAAVVNKEKPIDTKANDTNMEKPDVTKDDGAKKGKPVKNSMEEDMETSE